MDIKLKLLACFLLLLGCHTLCHGHSLLASNSSARKTVQIFDGADCDSVEGFTPELKKEIQSKSNDVERIIELVLNGPERHSTHKELAQFCDTFGPRLSGSRSLEQAIDYLKRKMRDESKLKVHGEKAMIPKWTVRRQWAQIISPRLKDMSILALGKSVGTNASLALHAVVVHSFDELDELGSAGKIKDRIVVYNYKWTSYGEVVKYRVEGASRAAKYGARAALVRSVTPLSIYSPHTGLGSQSIPTAAITVEDADLIQRYVDRNQSVRLSLYIEAENFDDVESENLVADIPGTSKPEEVVLVSGHMDSWYNTDGAMDDGGGMMISYKALDVLKKLNLTAKRTVRALLWTAEEFGLIGAKQYFKDHQHELQNFKVVMESDLGTFKPLGLSITNAGPLGKCVVKEILKLTEKIGTTRLDTKFEGSDIELFTDAGVPGLSLANENSEYFYLHHTAGDSITVEDPDHLDKSTILWAAASYVLADLSVDLRS